MYPGIVRAARRCVVRGSTSIGLDRRRRWLSLTRWLLPNRAHGPMQDEWQGETRLRVRLCGRSCTAACTVRRIDASQMHAVVDSSYDENVHQMCELPNYGRVLVATEVTDCGDARVMDGLLELTHLWQWSGEPYIPVCPSVGMNLGELSAGDLPRQGLLARVVESTSPGITSA